MSFIPNKREAELLRAIASASLKTKYRFDGQEIIENALYALADTAKEEVWKPYKGQDYWTPKFLLGEWFAEDYTWRDNDGDNRALSKGLCFLTRQACEAHVEKLKKLCGT